MAKIPTKSSTRNTRSPENQSGRLNRRCTRLVTHSDGDNMLAINGRA